MHLPHKPTATSPESDDNATEEPGEPSSEANIRAAEPRNLLVIASYQIAMRIGWIFKTESIVIPAFLDTIAGAGWIRGLLPVLNRVSQSVAPMLAADRVRRARRKKLVVSACIFAMAVCFLWLSAIWFAYGSENPTWLPAAFLVSYAVFFVFTGIAQLSSNTLQGKLIRPHRRGRLMSLSASVGAVLAIGFAWWLLGPWLKIPRADGQPGGGFAYIFAFTGVAFVISAVLVLVARERPDHGRKAKRAFREHLRGAVDILRSDRNFRGLVVVAMPFSTNMIVMPHYQALGRERLGLTLGSLVVWVIVQNAATGFYSVIAGTIADRRGNLVVLRYVLLATAAMPLVAIGIAALGPTVGGRLYWIVFVMFGMLPITLRILTNFTLELAPQAEHPRYLAALSLAMAVPFVLAPAVGWLVDLTSFEVVFVAAALVIGTGGLLTSRLEEPRILATATVPSYEDE